MNIMSEYSDEEKELLELIGVQICKICFLKKEKEVLDPESIELVMMLFSTIGMAFQSPSKDVLYIKLMAERLKIDEKIPRSMMNSHINNIIRRINEVNTGDTKGLIQDLIRKIGNSSHIKLMHEEFMEQFSVERIQKLKEISRYLSNQTLDDDEKLTKSIEIIRDYCTEMKHPTFENILKKKILDEALRTVEQNTNRHHLKTYISEYFEYDLEALKIDSHSIVCLDTETVIKSNILLIGKPNVGKKTFINGMDMFFKYQSLHEAVTSDDEFTVICDTEFDLYINDDQDYLNVKWNSRDSNLQNDGKYQIKSDNLELNLRTITLPADDLLKNIDFDTIDHVLIFVKSSDNNLDEVLKRTVKVLDEKNCQIKFVITHAKGSDFNMGCSVTLLNYLIEDLTNHIELRDSVYCVDNEGFRLLTACKTDPTILSLIPDEVKQSNASSWQQSRNSIKKLLDL